MDQPIYSKKNDLSLKPNQSIKITGLQICHNFYYNFLLVNKDELSNRVLFNGSNTSTPNLILVVSYVSIFTLTLLSSRSKYIKKTQKKPLNLPQSYLFKVKSMLKHCQSLEKSYLKLVFQISTETTLIRTFIIFANNIKIISRLLAQKTLINFFCSFIFTQISYSIMAII